MNIDNNNPSSTSTFFLLGGLIDPNDLLQNVDVSRKIVDILHHQCLNGADLEKLSHHDVYSIRTSGKVRVLFFDYLKGGKKYLLLLEYLPNHEYKKSKFRHGSKKTFFWGNTKARSNNPFG